MATYDDNSISHDVTTDAGFRAWAQKVHDALAAVGLVQTSDTGQINLTTVTAPALGAFAGYEIWRFNDAEQASHPIYMKVEYGKAGATTQPALRWTVGTGSNGSGTLTNPNTASPSAMNGGTPSGNGLIHACLANGSFNLEVYPTTATGTTILVVVERLRDPITNAYNAQGDVFFSGNSSNGPHHSSFLWRSGVWSSGTPIAAPGPSELGSGKFVPGYLMPLNGPYAPLIGVAYLPVSGAGSGDTGLIQTGPGDTTHTYKRLAVAAGATQYSLQAVTTVNTVKSADMVHLHE